MADETKAPKAPKEPEKKRYFNRTLVDQTVYLTSGESVRVPAGDTVLLDEAVALKHFGIFAEYESAEETKSVLNAAFAKTKK